jgi:hemolysin-activating ACP:hemolysin acyltransferase
MSCVSLLERSVYDVALGRSTSTEVPAQTWAWVDEQSRHKLLFERERPSIEGFSVGEMVMVTLTRAVAAVSKTIDSGSTRTGSP